jgi:hypothetical protein
MHVKFNKTIIAIFTPMFFNIFLTGKLVNSTNILIVLLCDIKFGY